MQSPALTQSYGSQGFAIYEGPFTQRRQGSRRVGAANVLRDGHRVKRVFGGGLRAERLYGEQKSVIQREAGARQGTGCGAGGSERVTEAGVWRDFDALLVR